MRRWVVVLSAFTISAAAATTVAGNATAGEGADPYTASGGMAGVVPAKAAVGAANPHSGSSPNLIYHGGLVRTSATSVQPIFWGTSWRTYSGDKVSGLEAFYGGVGGSGYMKSNIEYTQTGGAKVSAAVTRLTSLFDYSAAPSRAPKTADILAEVGRVVANPSPGAFYPVYVDTPRGHAGYCAWHSAGTINGVAVEFGFFFNLDNDPGCNVDAYPGQNVSPELAALANVSGHELSETVTDPQLNAWYDAQGYENSDKCAWTFDYPVTFGGKTWLIQGNWSNAAYNARSGYTKGGCIQEG